VAPDPDDGNQDAANPELQPPGLDDGSQWVRAEIRRRMAANRSSRGRHARRGDAAPEHADGPGERPWESSRRDASPPVAARRAPLPPAVPLTPADGIPAGDLPENYVPRHSELTPGPAAEPALPISGPIPVVRPETDDGPNTIETRSAPVGGPSLPPTGIPLPVRKRRSGPGRPLQSDGPTTGPWLRPGTSIVPNEPVQRLGAPPGMLGGAEPLPSWGVPASPPHGFGIVTPPPGTAVGDARVDDADDADDT
jgi:hypothetical protein